MEDYLKALGLLTEAQIAKLVEYSNGKDFVNYAKVVAEIEKSWGTSLSIDLMDRVGIKESPGDYLIKNRVDTEEREARAKELYNMTGGFIMKKVKEGKIDEAIDYTKGLIDIISDKPLEAPDDEEDEE